MLEELKTWRFTCSLCKTHEDIQQSTKPDLPAGWDYKDGHYCRWCNRNEILKKRSDARLP